MAFISVRLTDDYATSPFSAGVRALRHLRNDHGGVNYATFWYGAGLGLVQALTDGSGAVHSEKTVWLGLRNIAPYGQILIPNWLPGQLAGANQTAQALFNNTGAEFCWSIPSENHAGPARHSSTTSCWMAPTSAGTSSMPAKRRASSSTTR